MKKLMFIYLLIFTLSFSQEILLNIDEIKREDGRYYKKETKELLNEEIKVVGKGIDGYYINSYKEGKLIKSTNHFDGTIYDEFEFLDNYYHGRYFNNSDHSIKRVGTREYGIYQGTYEYFTMGKSGRVEVVNGIYHGKVVEKIGGKEVTSYYNKGYVVGSAEEVEEFEKIDFQNALMSNCENRIKVFSKEDKFTGNLVMKDKSDNLMSVFVIDNGELIYIYNYKSIVDKDGYVYYEIINLEDYSTADEIKVVEYADMIMTKEEVIRIKG